MGKYFHGTDTMAIVRNLMPAVQKLILLVEDSADDVFLFKRALTKAFLTNPVQAVCDVDDAIRYFEGTDPYNDRSVFPLPAIAVIDLHMPNKDGFQLLAWLQNRPQFASLQIIAVSGIERLNEMRRAYQMRATSFLTKPIKSEDLRNLARSFPAQWS